MCALGSRERAQAVGVEVRCGRWGVQAPAYDSAHSSMIDNAFYSVRSPDYGGTSSSVQPFAYICSHIVISFGLFSNARVFGSLLDPIR